jgi:hypothetical protein
LVGTKAAGDSLGRVAGVCADARGSRFERRVAASRLRQSKSADICFLLTVRREVLLSGHVGRYRVLTVSYAAVGPETVECVFSSRYYQSLPFDAG